MKGHNSIRCICGDLCLQCFDAVGWAAGRACKNWVVRCWRGCLERGADWHMAQLMPLPLTVSFFSKIQIGFTFLVPAHLGSPGKGPLNGCVCVCQLMACSLEHSLCLPVVNKVVLHNVLLKTRHLIIDHNSANVHWFQNLKDFQFTWSALLP